MTDTNVNFLDNAVSRFALLTYISVYSIRQHICLQLKPSLSCRQRCPNILANSYRIGNVAPGIVRSSILIFPLNIPMPWIRGNRWLITLATYSSHIAARRQSISTLYGSRKTVENITSFITYTLSVNWVKLETLISGRIHNLGEDRFRNSSILLYILHLRKLYCR